MSQVYFVQGLSSKMIKIGITRDLAQRLRDLQANSPEKLLVLGTVSGSAEIESRLHWQFSHLRQHGEWFTEAPELLDYIVAHCPQAEKREYLPITGSSYRVWPLE